MHSWPADVSKYFKIYCLPYTLPWTGFELTVLVVIGTDYEGTCKFNYHWIAITTTPWMSSFVFCVMLWTLFFVLLSFFLFPIVCSVLLRFTPSDYPFDIIKLFLFLSSLNLFILCLVKMPLRCNAEPQVSYPSLVKPKIIKLWFAAFSKMK
jgi:hypothetical protein